jgi:hypothetical protein
MPGDPRMRASDADRDRAASLLREHHAAGRLTAEEFGERLDAAYEAKTLGEIDHLMADLPSIDLYRLPDESMRRTAHAASSAPAAPGGGHGRLSPAWRGAWASWASVSMVLFAIWLITAVGSGGGNLHNLWFLWVAGPWGAILLGRWLFGGHPGGGPARPLPGPQASRVHELRAQRQAEREAERRERRDRRGPGPREF